MRLIEQSLNLTRIQIRRSILDFSKIVLLNSNENWQANDKRNDLSHEGIQERPYTTASVDRNIVDIHQIEEDPG